MHKRLESNKAVDSFREHRDQPLTNATLYLESDKILLTCLLTTSEKCRETEGKMTPMTVMTKSAAQERKEMR